MLKHSRMLQELVLHGSTHVFALPEIRWWECSYLAQVDRLDPPGRPLPVLACLRSLTNCRALQHSSCAKPELGLPAHLNYSLSAVLVFEQIGQRCQGLADKILGTTDAAPTLQPTGAPTAISKSNLAQDIRICN